MKLSISIVVSCVLLTACATTAPSSSSSGPPLSKLDNKALQSQFANEILTMKLMDNGAKLLCAQPDYLACYQITAAQCHTELAPYNAACLSMATQKVGKLGDAANQRRYAGVFSMCLAVQHLLIYQQSASQIATCLKDAQYDSAAAAAALLH